MNKLLTLLIVALLSVMSGCVQPPDKPNTCDAEDCEPNPDPDPNGPDLKGTFISGHLGNYADCPGDGYTPDQPAPGDQKASPDGDFAEGACAEGFECNPILNCEGAQTTIRLTNGGAGDAVGVEVILLELFGTDGVARAELPLLGTINTDTNETFDGTIEAGEDVTLRIDFQGPQNPYQLLAPAADGDADERFGVGGSGLLEITVTPSNSPEETVIESTEIYSMPSVDT